MAATYVAEPSRFAPAVIGVTAVGAYVAALSWSMEHATYDVWGALISVPLLVVISVPLLRRAIRIEGERWFTSLFIAAFALKLGGGLARYFVVQYTYSGVADANSFDQSGQRLSHLWIHGQFSIDTGSSIVGNGFLRLLTAAVYTLSGPSRISGFVVFSWIGFWGLYFAYRAFRLALPDGAYRRYALLVFFLPSLLFWPSSIGKEAWMTFSVGLIALGAAKLYVRRRGGYVVLALGLAAGALVRPHVIVFAVAGVLVGYVLGPRRRPGPASAVWKTVGVAVLTVAAFILIHRAAGFVGLHRISGEEITSTLKSIGGRTSEAGSHFTPTPVNSPADFPKGLVTVLFRPFPWEAHNAQAVVSSIEGLALVALMVLSWRRLLRLPKLLLRRPYVAFCVIYMILFVYAFSAFSNFGILVRERVQVLPFFLVLAALPLRAPPPAPVGRHRQIGSFELTERGWAR